MFTTEQVKQFKEAFNMIDQDGDGRVTEDDLRVMLSNLGTFSFSIDPLTPGRWTLGWKWEVGLTNGQVKPLLQPYLILYSLLDQETNPHQRHQNNKESISPNS